MRTRADPDVLFQGSVETLGDFGKAETLDNSIDHLIG
jgi:hypothetical protein